MLRQWPNATRLGQSPIRPGASIYMRDRQGRVVSSAHRLHACDNIADLRSMASRRLLTPIFHRIDGGDDDTWTLARLRAGEERGGV